MFCGLKPTALLDREVVDELVREWNVEAGARLREARKALNLSQVTAARLADTTPETLCRVEMGALLPRDGLRAVLAAVVGKDVADIWPPFTRRELTRRAKAVA